jgi:hypothetical protein
VLDKWSFDPQVFSELAHFPSHSFRQSCHIPVHVSNVLRWILTAWSFSARYFTSSRPHHVCVLWFSCTAVAILEWYCFIHLHNILEAQKRRTFWGWWMTIFKSGGYGLQIY